MNKCRICKNNTRIEIINAKELFIGTRAVYQYALCLDCGSLSICDLPHDLAEIYSKYPVFDFTLKKGGVLKHFVRQYILLKKNSLARFFLRFLNSWEDLAFKSLYEIGLQHSMRILDVGCGSGVLLNFLHDLGFLDITGIDPFLKAPVEKPGFRLIKGNISDVQEKFDLIMCHHSFEHMEDLSAVAKHLESITNPGGTLLIRMPNIESYSFRKYQECWHGIHAPFHIALPSSKGMQLIFQNTNFELCKTKQEQLVELFLYNIDCSLNIALLEPLGVINCIGDGALGNKIPAPFIREEISYLKKKTKSVLKNKMADYISYYYRKRT